MKQRKTLYIAAGFVLLLATSVSAAPTYTFQNITNNSSTNATTGESQLSVELINLGSNSVEFLFVNSGLLASSITDIYFDNGNLGTLSGPIGFTDAVGTVSFAAGATPGNLPGGNDVDFDTTLGLSADSDAPVQPNGINPREQLGLNMSGDYTDIVNQIAAGTLRIGIHVQGFADGGSEGFINNLPTTSVVPAPGSILLSGIGLSIVGLLRNRKNAVLN